MEEEEGWEDEVEYHSLGYNFLGTCPNWIKSVPLECLRSLVSNGISFVVFGPSV